ncbi:3-hydroxyacyl-CoA dehydrogenase [Geminicoccaceae bacterium 1502E]|nr:3-hydroxyacyl-CoA dehydrogenase [Geminicoccaceae bacterium 1502E]
MSETVAIVGAGLIGRAWAIAFARAGWSVRLWDADPAVPARTLATIEPLLADMAHHGLLAGQDVQTVMARMAPVTDLGEALAGVAWVQENAPEKVEVKRELWARMDPLAPREAILASSTSAIVPSRFTEHLEGRERCVVAHPLNPPYLIPAVEVVPAPWTSKVSMDRAATVMRAIGQAPIMMTRELDGFVMNRMQGALLEEAFRLVADGLCTAEEIDIGLREGLALRWSFMGPFETIDLNAPGGVRDYVTRYQGIYENLFPSMQRRVDWAGPVLEKVEKERRERVAEDALAERQNWRDRRLMALAGHKRRAAKDIGD